MWYRGSKQFSADAAATSRYLHEVDLAAAAGNVTMTLPATGPDPTYCGFVNASAVTNGSKVVIIQTPAAVEVARLSAAGESVWLGRNPITGAWEILAYANPSEYQWTWANATERIATAASAAQIGRIGWQTDMARKYELLSLTRWGELFDSSLGIERSYMTIGGSTTAQSYGLTAVVGAGTLTARTPSNTSRATGLLRVGNVTSAVAGNIALVRGGGGTQAPLSAQGYRYLLRATLGAVSASMRWFMGLAFSAPAANVDPSTFTNCLGMGTGGVTANARFYNNDAAGAATETDLGASFPSATLNTGLEFELYTFDGSSYAMQARNLVTGAEVSASFSANVPANNVQYLWMFYAGNNADAVAVSLDPADLRLWQVTR